MSTKTRVFFRENAVLKRIKNLASGSGGKKKEADVVNYNFGKLHQEPGLCYIALDDMTEGLPRLVRGLKEVKVTLQAKFNAGQQGKIKAQAVGKAGEVRWEIMFDSEHLLIGLVPQIRIHVAGSSLEKVREIFFDLKDGKTPGKKRSFGGTADNVLVETAPAS